MQSLSRLSPEARAAALETLDADSLRHLQHDWMVWARDDQLPPSSTAAGTPWATWLVLGGRGAGKTRTGAEWVRARALGLDGWGPRVERIALVGETLGQVRSVMLEGVSGLLAVHAPGEEPTYVAARNELLWPNGTLAQMFAADDPDSLRGPQFDAAWCDELAKWPRPERAWDTLQLALRLGQHPQVIVTTTPRSHALLKRIADDPMTALSRSRTADNAQNLAPSFLADMIRRYGGTSFGAQELEGLIVEERLTGLWRRDWIEQARVQRRPELSRIVVAVDPPITATAGSDSCGIIVAGLGVDRRAYVIADRTLQGRDPSVWARAAIAAYRDFQADVIVAEANQGGDLVLEVFKTADATVPVRKVTAARGKFLRAEPVSVLYTEGRVIHVGTFPELEHQMCDFAADGLSNGRSPDRLDALVWAITELMLTNTRTPIIRSL